jgi:hypothetical protein
MWTLIRVELTYYKTLLIILYACILPFIVINTFRSGFEEHLARAMWITVPIIVIAMNSEEKKSKKNPLYAKLPVSKWRIGIVRLSVWVPFWLSLVMLFWLSCRIGGSHRIVTYFPWLILTLGSSMIIIGSFSSTVLDLRYCFREKVLDKTLAGCIIMIPWILALMYLLMSVSGPIGPYLARVFFSPQTSILMTILAVLLIILSVAVYNCRKSYLE